MHRKFQIGKNTTMTYSLLLIVLSIVGISLPSWAQENSTPSYDDPVVGSLTANAQATDTASQQNVPPLIETATARALPYTPTYTPTPLSPITVANAYNVVLMSELKGRSGIVTSLAFSPQYPDGSLLAAGSSDTTIVLWNTKTSQSVTLSGHNGDILSVTFSPDGNLLASASADNTIMLWDVATGIQKRTFAGHTDDVWSIAFSPDGTQLVSGSADNTLRLWNVETGTQIGETMSTDNADVLSVAFSPDGDLIASGGTDNKVRVWFVETQDELIAFEGHTTWVLTVAFSPTGDILASGGADNTILFWNTNDASLGGRIDGAIGDVVTLLFSPLNTGRLYNLLAYSGEDGSIVMVDVSDITDINQISILPSQGDRVKTIAFNADGSLLASASASVIYIWSVGYASQEG